MKSLSAAVVAGILMLASCSKNNDVLNSGDTQNVNSESVSASSTSETADISTSVITYANDTKLNSGSRIAGTIEGVLIDGRLKGATITITPNGNSTWDVPQGTITINFGTGQTDDQGIVRKGIIYIDYYGRRFKSGSWRKIRFSGYSRSNIVFDDSMTYTVTNESDSTATPFKFHHVLASGKLTFPDATTINRISDIHVEWNYNSATPSLSTITHKAGGTASGVTRRTKEYAMAITKDIVYKVSCLATKVYIPVSGTKTITVTGGLEYTIDYGDGTCDNTVTITVGGKTAIITVNGDGN